MKKIRQYCERTRIQLWLKFNLIRLGTTYEKGNDLEPVPEISNDTIIALGDCLHNGEFTNFGNEQVSFLLDDDNLDSILGNKFRRRFPSVWCTLGYYLRDFKITSEFEKIMNQFRYFDLEYFHMPCTELELGISVYKDLRDWKLIYKFVI